MHNANFLKSGKPQTKRDIHLYPGQYQEMNMVQTQEHAHLGCSLKLQEQIVAKKNLDMMHCIYRQSPVKTPDIKTSK